MPHRSPRTRSSRAMAAAREPPSTRSQRNNPCFDDPRSATARPPNPSPPISARRKPGTIASSEEHTSELQSLMRISYAVFCLKKKNKKIKDKLTIKHNLEL